MLFISFIITKFERCMHGACYKRGKILKENSCKDELFTI